MEDYKQELSDKLLNVKNLFESEYGEIVALGAHPSLLNRVQINYYGDIQPIKNLANISAKDFETLIVTPYDFEILKDLSKVISQSNLNLNAQIDGKTIRIHVPKMTEERRKELVKKAKEILEEAKIKVRNIRKTLNNKIKSNEEHSENEKEIYQQQLQKQIDDFNIQLENIFESKKSDLLKV